MSTFRVVGYNIFGEATKDFRVDVADSDGAHFIAHQILHADGIVCCEVFGSGGELVLQRCDPDVNFNEVVRA